jgi:hypothetical protein
MSSPHSYFSHAALAFAAMPGLFGIGQLLRPEAALAGAGIVVPNRPDTQQLTRTLMRFFGVRNIAISYLLVLIWSMGSPKVVGYSIFAGIWMSAWDGLLIKKHVGSGEWGSWSFIPVFGGVAAGLLGWFSQ